ncbi:hypothetical protein [Kitasatospora terrestris]|uniref:Uncharacterized protein n=1 Tax=Kitasatospora terrestris TaxID=258051 RepID=A0ABP9DF61_9ACTN
MSAADRWNDHYHQGNGFRPTTEEEPCCSPNAEGEQNPLALAAAGRQGRARPGAADLKPGGVAGRRHRPGGRRAGAGRSGRLPRLREIFSAESSS